MKLNKIVVALFAAGVMASPLANATNGYFAIGYGVKSQGMGGVGIALPQDSLAAAENPAGMVMVGDRADVGVEYFKPVRTTTISGTGAGNPGVGVPASGTYHGDDTSSFFVPDAGYNKMISADSSLGVSVYGNGGMNTNYANNPAFGVGNAGVDLMQLFVAPTWATKINANNEIGISLNLAYQQFAASGLQGFGVMNSTGGNLGYDSSTGYGLHIGWTGQVSSAVTLGAMYQTKTWMGKLSTYNHLFAEQGGFDIPATYGVGIAVKATPDTTIAMDVQRIDYAGVASIANVQTTAAPLGADNGSGFGWQNMTVYKLGVSQKVSDSLTLRAGYNHNNQQIPSTQTMFNILAPGVVQDHLTLGATWTLADKSEISAGYVHAFAKSVTSSNSPYGPGSAINLNMHEDSIMVSYGW